MNGADVLRIVDLMHREKNIPKDVIFEGIEAALQLATQKQYGLEAEIAITIDRESEGELRDLYGDVGYTIIDDVLTLPERMPNIYRRLTS